MQKVLRYFSGLVSGPFMQLTELRQQGSTFSWKARVRCAESGNPDDVLKYMLKYILVATYPQWSPFLRLCFVKVWIEISPFVVEHSVHYGIPQKSEISKNCSMESVQNEFVNKISGMRDLHSFSSSLSTTRLVYLSLRYPQNQRRRERLIILHKL